MWKRDPIMMRNYIIIVGWASGNVMMQTWNNGLKSFMLHFFSQLKVIP
jgi:hypothetical protein